MAKKKAKAKPKKVVAKPKKAEAKEKEIGEVFSYFAKIGVAALKLNSGLKVGDKIKFKGATTDFEQTVDSMQIERKPVQSVKKGDDVGIKVNDRVRPGDKVILIK